MLSKSDNAYTLGEIEEKIELAELTRIEIEDFINYWFVKHMASADAPLVVFAKRYKEQFDLTQQTLQPDHCAETD